VKALILGLRFLDILISNPYNPRACQVGRHYCENNLKLASFTLGTEQEVCYASTTKT